MEQDTVSANQRIVKRRIMEAQGGAQVRRLHILYFLSRNGHNQHPHLIRIHHLSNNGVRLKDFKRWLGEVRGKDIPESFAWSYKRRYKTGYVWQDLLDHDLITPISDNEYILKGSQISLSTNNIDFSELPMEKVQSSLHELAADRQLEASSQSSMCVSSPKPSPKIEESSTTFGSETSSTLTDDSAKQDSEKNSDTLNHEEVNSSASLSKPLLNTDKKWKTKKVNIVNDNHVISTSSNKPRSRKSHSSGIFRNLIRCGVDDTDESAVVIARKRSRPFLKPCSSHSAVRVKNSTKEIQGEFREQMVPCAAYKPLYGPTCSQCGKRFRPEKLHSHMKSCKGIKALARGSSPPLSAAENISIKSTTSRNEDSMSGYLLTR